MLNMFSVSVIICVNSILLPRVSVILVHLKSIYLGSHQVSSCEIFHMLGKMLSSLYQVI